MKLFLDDERAVKDVTWIELPLGPWTVAKNYRQFVEWITANGLPDFVSFDNDLHESHYPWYPGNEADYRNGLIRYEKFTVPTGYHAAQWLCEYCGARKLPFPPYTVHSMNEVARRDIPKIIEEYKRASDSSS